jgi:hypothetical protein
MIKRRDSMKNLLNRKELCEATNGKLTMYTIGELTRRGDIPVIKIKNMRVYLYDYDAVMAWLSGLQQGTAGQGLRLAK